MRKLSRRISDKLLEQFHRFGADSSLTSFALCATSMSGMKVRRQSKNRNALIEEYQGYARHVVARLCERMGLPLEHFDEFLAAAYLGLVEAAERFRS